MPKYTILCVDDEPSILNSLRRVLYQTQYRVLLCTTAQEALSVLAQEKVDLIISDYRMPAMTGAELLKKVKERYPKTVRTILSGYSEPQVILEAIQMGDISHYITKPWEEQELLQIIKSALESE
jgi:response regulator RpfG family c-di-GMP phosphodiesterase